ncbi:MAG: MarR family transcriptional regulator [Prevotella sp.]|jgi:DNA-binding MarR family transcriptional regulator|nr:MarR family transcriptional regulator [Prevotella sp.]
MEGNCKLGNPNEDIGYLIWRVFKYWQKGKLKILDEFGLTSSQLELLGAIYHISRLKTEATQIILSQETEIDPMTTSTILRNLEKKGLISRRESATDTRARIVELTRAGTELFEKAIAKLKAGQKRLFQNIDAETLKNQLRMLLQEMDRLDKTI